MKIQIFSQYYNLAQAGRVKPLACPNHKDEEAIYKLVHSVDEDENIMLQCLSCGYSQKAGIQLYENILEKIKEVSNA
jgi:uncharacterized Zn finger protein